MAPISIKRFAQVCERGDKAYALVGYRAGYSDGCDIKSLRTETRVAVFALGNCEHNRAKEDEFGRLRQGAMA
jgi:hypothetical protein